MAWPAAGIGCVPARIRGRRGGGVHPGHEGQLGGRAEHRACRAPAAGGDQLAGHLGLLAGLGWGQRAAGRRRPAGAAADRGPAGRGGRTADLGRVHRARRCSGAGRRTAAGQRAHRGGRQLPGYPARGRDRGGGHRAALPEPAGAPDGVVSDHRGGACFDLRRDRAAGERRLQRRAGLGRRRGPAPGRGLTTGPAVGGGDHRLDRRPARRSGGHSPGAPPDLGGRADHRPRPGGHGDRAVGLRPGRPTPGCWRNCGDSACTETPGPP